MADSITTRYIKVEGKGATHLRADLYYDIGGYDYLTHKVKPRGYYISVVPVERCDRGLYVSETMTAFRGIKMLIKEVSRKSSSAAAQAEQLAEQRLQELINWVCLEYNLKTKEVVA